MPGLTAFTRIPCGASSFDQPFVNVEIAALAAAYIVAPSPPPLRAAIELTFTIDAALLADHRRHDGLRQEPHALHVQVHHGVIDIFGRFHQLGPLYQVAGVVDQNVELLVSHTVDQLVDAIHVSEIGLD